MKGFKILEATCKDLKRELADSNEKIYSGEQAYATLEAKARSDEASYKELISELEDKVRSCDTAFTEGASQMQEKAEAAFARLVSETEERIRIDQMAHVAHVSQVEDKIKASEAAFVELLGKAEECEGALKQRESVRFITSTPEFIGLNGTQELSSLRETIRESATCGVCHEILTEPYR